MKLKRAWESLGEPRRAQKTKIPLRVPSESDSPKKEVNIGKNIGLDISHISLRRSQVPEMPIWVFRISIIFIIIIISHTFLKAKIGGNA